MISASYLYNLYVNASRAHSAIALSPWSVLSTEAKDTWQEVVDEVNKLSTSTGPSGSAVSGPPSPPSAYSAYQPGSTFAIANAALKPLAVQGPDLETTALRALALFGRHKPTCSPLTACECGFAAVEAQLSEELTRARGAS